MNEMKRSCAPTDRQPRWENIDWDKCDREVRKLQARIVKAQKEGRYGKVKSLQWLLTHSFTAKALAVKRVTSNKGRIHREWTRYYGLLLLPRRMPFVC